VRWKDKNYYHGPHSTNGGLARNNDDKKRVKHHGHAGPENAEDREKKDGTARKSKEYSRPGRGTEDISRGGGELG